MRKIAIITMEGFNELDSFIASAMINRVKQPGLKALIVCPTESVSSVLQQYLPQEERAAV